MSNKDGQWSDQHYSLKVFNKASLMRSWFKSTFTCSCNVHESDRSEQVWLSAHNGGDGAHDLTQDPAKLFSLMWMNWFVIEMELGGTKFVKYK